MTYDFRKVVAKNIRGTVRACKSGDKILLDPWDFNAGSSACSYERKTGADYKIEWAENKTHVIITKL